MRPATDGRIPSRRPGRSGAVGIGRYVIVDSSVLARKRARWQGRANVERFAEEIGEERAAQRLKNNTEIGIVRRFMRRERILDVGIGTGRISLPLLDDGVQLTGVDASAAMIQRCGIDPRAATVRLVKGQLEELPFAHESFDTVISVDAFAHFPEWAANLDELLRVTSFGGRVIVDVGSRDHIDAVARSRGCSPNDVAAGATGPADDYEAQLSYTDLRDYAAERGIALIALVPYGAVLGSLVPNHWIGKSYAARSGGIDRLVSWAGTDSLLFSFAEFIERRVVAYCPASSAGRMFAVFERDPIAAAFPEPVSGDIALCDERGAVLWRDEFDAHVQHEPNRAFIMAFILAAWPVRLPAALRDALPDALRDDLDRAERSLSIDDVAADVANNWRTAAKDVAFRGVDFTDVFAELLQSELRGRLEASE